MTLPITQPPVLSQSGQTHRLSKGSTTGHPQTAKGNKALMDKKNLMPIAAQPVNRTTTGQLPPELAELSEEALQLYGEDAKGSSASVLPSERQPVCWCWCSYDGDDAE
jgi:bacteriocin leader peptide (microcyclamide/patellamide family)